LIQRKGMAKKYLSDPGKYAPKFMALFKEQLSMFPALKDLVENLTPEQEAELAQYLEQQGYPTPQEKFGLFNFFGKIVKSKTTRKNFFLR